MLGPAFSEDPERKPEAKHVMKAEIAPVNIDHDANGSRLGLVFNHDMDVCLRPVRAARTPECML